jgi:hypothetical protein
MSTTTDTEPKLRVRFLRDSVADKQTWLAGQEASISASDARMLAINGLPGGRGGPVCIGPPPSVEILS